MNKNKIISTGVGTPGHTLVNTFYIINQNVDVTGAFLLPPSLPLFLCFVQVEKASQNKVESEIEHRRLTVEYQKIQKDCHALETKLKRSLRKSR